MTNQPSQSDSSNEEETSRVSFCHKDSVELIQAKDVESLWYSSNDYDCFRKRLRDDAESLKTKVYGILLRNSFDESSTLSQKYLTAFAKLPGEQCLRGCEGYVSKQHLEERDRLVRRRTQAVLRHQEILKDEKGISAEGRAEKLRCISKKNSRGSRVFGGSEPLRPRVMAVLPFGQGCLSRHERLVITVIRNSTCCSP